MSAADRLSETIGYCEGLCGGLHSHHLIDGLCPECQNNINIQMIDTEPRELDFNDNDVGMDAFVFIPNAGVFGLDPASPGDDRTVELEL